MKCLKKILFYISGHGFGHTLRMIEVMKQLYLSRDKISCIVKTTSPKWLFDLSLNDPFDYFSFKGDIGVIQRDSLNLDKLKTLREYAELLKIKEILVKDETQYAERNKVSVIVGDIPPIAFDISQRINIPGIAIGNFSWDWIYKDYVREFPQYQFLIEEIKNSYSKADMLLRLPFYGDMSIFSRKEDVSLIIRDSDLSKDEIIKRLGLEKYFSLKKKVVLLSFGGFYNARIDFNALNKLKDYFFLSFSKIPLKNPENIKVLPPRFIDHHHLLKVCDIVISKPGYGIVAECIANKKPLLYTSRGDFAEYPILTKGMKRYIPSLFIPRKDFHSGEWGSYLNDILLSQKKKREEMKCSGAKEAAKKILKFL